LSKQCSEHLNLSFAMTSEAAREQKVLIILTAGKPSPDQDVPQTKISNAKSTSKN